MIDLNYNFLFNNTNNNLITTKRTANNISWFVNGSPYTDPDTSCNKLYQYHKKIWSTNLPNGNQIQTLPLANEYPWKVQVNNDIFRMGSDYIAFSKNWITADISDAELTEALQITRTFAGHIMWCKGLSSGWIDDNGNLYYSSKVIDNKFFITINTAKGGKRGLFDRIDWTLILLKIYFLSIKNDDFDERKNNFFSNAITCKLTNYNSYSDRESSVCFNPQISVLRMFYSFENSREWLKLFCSFKGFCDYFVLKRSFVNDDYNIIFLADLFPVLPSSYKAYMFKTVSSTLNRKDELKIYNKNKLKIN